MIPITIGGATLALFKMDLFGAAHGWVGQKGPPAPPLNQLHKSYKDETWHNYTLPKEDPTNI